MRESLACDLSNLYKSNRLRMNYHTTDNAMLDYDSLTPRLRECLKIKNQYPNSIVLFQGGKSYEAYGLDAIELARSLERVKTKKLATSPGLPESFIHLVSIPSYEQPDILMKLALTNREVVIVTWESIGDQIKRSIGFARLEVAVQDVAILETARDWLDYLPTF